MDSPVLRLYPPPADERPLRGLYLDHDLRVAGRDRPFVYTNFIASLDGRIAQPDPETRRKRVPPAVANERDWRLYLELAAQSDVLLTTARHLRAVAEERHADLLGFEAADDLLAWRRDRGLPEYPRVAAISVGLDIPVQRLPPVYRQRLLVVTSSTADHGRVSALEEAGIEVIRAGSGERLSGRQLVDALVARDLCYIYSIAGPRMHHTLLVDGVLERLYMTLAHRLLGGEEGDTLVRGRSLDPPPGFLPLTIYLDPAALDGCGQLFACYRRGD